MSPPNARVSVFRVLHNPTRGSLAGRWLNYCLALVIVTNAAAVALETVPAIYLRHEAAFHWLESISTVIFLAEYIARLWVCVEEPRFASPIAGRIKYALQPLPTLDLIVIATYFAPVDLRFLRIFRLTRLLRVFKLDEFDRAFRAISHSIARRKSLLTIAVAAMLTVAYCFAAVLYIVEHEVQPDKFTSIPETLWWAVVTLTTIGYGDITPITTAGKVLSGGIVLVGIGVFALPSAIVTASILEVGGNRQTCCPHCGKDLP